MKVLPGEGFRMRQETSNKPGNNSKQRGNDNPENQFTIEGAGVLHEEEFENFYDQIPG